MIPRYEEPSVARLWSDQYKYEKYLEVEIALISCLEDFDIVPKGCAQKFLKAKINPIRISEIEKITNHDVIAFCTSITEQFAAEDSRFFHFGITSSDIIDTAHGLILKENLQIVVEEMNKLLTILKNKINETSDLLCIGRSHGIFAEAMIFGQKLASFSSELSRRLGEYKDLEKNLTGKISGAVGSYTFISPEIEESTLKKLNLKTELVSSQVIPRDQYAKIVCAGSLLASLFERFSTELRLLQHSDIDEAKEGFSKGQKGSSAMPHKKNPITSENITGLSRLLRSHYIVALENCNLWHERDISHSSSERMMFPDHFGLIVHLLKKSQKLFDNLVLDREKTENKVKRNFQIYSSYLLNQLILKNPHASRESLYEIIQTMYFEMKQNISNEEFVTLVTATFERNNLSHNVNEWTNFEKLKNHYQIQFQKVLNRI